MKEFIIYPAIDLRNGKVVRLSQGRDDQQTIYDVSPQAVALSWIEQGAEYLHVVNLNGAFGEQTDDNEDAIEKILAASKGKVKIQLGGGIRTRSGKVSRPVTVPKCTAFENGSAVYG